MKDETEKCKSCKYYDKEKSNENWAVCLNISNATLEFKSGKIKICPEYEELT
jgi:hypothetical protein